MSQHNTDVAGAAPWPPEQTTPSYSLDLREIARVLRRNVKIIVATPIVLLLLAIVFVSVVTPLYTATSTIFIDPRRPNVAEGNAQAQPNFGTDDSSIESQVLLIQSVSVMQRVVDNLKLTEDPDFAPQPGLRAWLMGLFKSETPEEAKARADASRMIAAEALAKAVKVLRQKATFLVDIRATSRDPEKAARIANAVAESYFTEQVRSKYDAAKIAGGWMGGQIAELKTRVIAADKAVQDFRSANNLQASQGVTVNDQQITDLNTRLIEARTQTAEAKAKYDQVREISKSGGDSGSVAEALSSDVIARLRSQYADLAKSEADLSTRYGPRHPLVAPVRAQMRDTQRLINTEISRILQGRKHAYEVAAAREAALQKSLDGLQNVASESGEAQVRLRELQREAEANRTLYESFLARYKETSAQESLELPESRVVTKAQVPLRPSFPKVLLTLGLAVVIGLGLGCVLALVRDYLDRRIKSLDEASAVSGLPGLAAIPVIGSRELARLAQRGRKELDHYDPATTRLLPPALQPPLMRYAVEQPTSAFAESVRAIRMAVQREARVRQTQVVMVTSAVGSEGKTTLAANLALSLAAIGLRTVLVEGDLRNPELTRSLCPRAQFGLVEAATGEVPLHQAMVLEPSTRLAVLPAPRQADRAMLAEFVPSDGMARVLTQLREHFDLIIVDAPPLLPLVDGRALAEQADCILLAVGWDRTPQEVFLRAVRFLAPVYDRVIGTVLTRVDFSRLRFYDSYYGGQYGGAYEYQPRETKEAA
ncbi:MAG: GumC family protein [Variibacter sp.]